MPEGVPSIFRWCKRCNAWTDWLPIDQRFVEFEVCIRVPDEGHREIGPIVHELPAGPKALTHDASDAPGANPDLNDRLGGSRALVQNTP